MRYIESRSNKIIVDIRKLISSKKHRREEGLFVCDGQKYLDDALKSKADIKSVFISRDIPDGCFDIPEDIQVYRLSENVMDSLSEAKTPQGVMFTVKLPDTELCESVLSGNNIILENLQDPGNVGAILRSADAFGLSAAILTGSCADPFSPKSLRGASGAVFRLKIYETGLSGLLELAERSPLRIIAAELSGRAQSVREINLKNSSVVIGNEGSGISKELLSICAESVIIPMKSGCQSLNAAAAAAVLMYEMNIDR